MRIEILNLDDAQAGQSTLIDRSDAVHCVQTWGPKIRMGCSFWRYRAFEEAIPSSAKSRLTILGSGDFHHVTLALLRKLERPCHLVIIDKHPDWVRRMPIMHCGTWVAHALKLPNVRNIYHFGGDLDFDNFYRHLAPRAELRSGRIKVFPAHRQYATGDWPKIAHPPLRRNPDQPATLEELQSLLQPLAFELGQFPLYISLDKDVMRAEEAVVNWDSGLLHLTEILDLLKAIFEMNRKPLIGADILGDWSPVKMFGPMRKCLDWSEHPKLETDATTANAINEWKNLRLVEMFGTTSE